LGHAPRLAAISKRQGGGKKRNTPENRNNVGVTVQGRPLRTATPLRHVTTPCHATTPHHDTTPRHVTTPRPVASPRHVTHVCACAEGPFAQRPSCGKVSDDAWAKLSDDAWIEYLGMRSQSIPTALGESGGLRQGKAPLHRLTSPVTAPRLSRRLAQGLPTRSLAAGAVAGASMMRHACLASCATLPASSFATRACSCPVRAWGGRHACSGHACEFAPLCHVSHTHVSRTCVTLGGSDLRHGLFHGLPHGLRHGLRSPPRPAGDATACGRRHPP
jgi:hypothetical protein